MSDKIVSLDEAIGEIQNGDIVFVGGVLDSRIPMAAIYEMIRQKKRNLIALSILALEDPAVGAGCFGALIGCYAWLGAFGKAPCIARKYESGELIVEDLGHNDSLLIYLSAFGLSGVVSKYSVGSDLLNLKYSKLDKVREIARNKDKIPKVKYAKIEDPFFGGEKILLPTIKPDIAVIHVQQVGTEGTCRIFGVEGIDSMAAFAADKVIVTAEEIVPEDYLRDDPNRNSIPCNQVDMIVEVPWGAHPSVVSHYYDLDLEFIMNYIKSAATQEGFERWLEEWVLSVETHEGYLGKLGMQRLEKLKAVKGYGFRPRTWLRG